MLHKINETGTWRPISINSYDNFLKKVIGTGHGYKHPYALRRNIAYNLQYLEFLLRCNLDIKLTSVLETQLCKNIIIVGCGIVESITHYLLIKKNLYKLKHFVPEITMPGNEKEFCGEKRKIDTIIYKKLDSPILDIKNFDSMIKTAKSNKVFGQNNIYEKIDDLRNLRNKVHLHNINNETDTDWNTFTIRDKTLMLKILHYIFTSNIFRPSEDEKEYFDFLK